MVSRMGGWAILKRKDAKTQGSRLNDRDCATLRLSFPTSDYVQQN